MKQVTWLTFARNFLISIKICLSTRWVINLNFPLVFMTLVVTSSHSQTVELLRDFNTTQSSTFFLPDKFDGYEFNGKLFFWADNGNYGTEPHIYDPLSGDLFFLDIIKGKEGSAPSSSHQYVVYYNKKLYFNANDKIHGEELWSWDGTKFNLVADINTHGDSDPRYLTVFNNNLYFSARGDSGKELYRMNIKEQIKLIGDINPSGSSDPEHLNEVNGQLIFFASASGSGCDIWKYSDRNQSLKLVDNFDDSGTCNAYSVTNINNERVMFYGTTTDYGSEPHSVTDQELILIKDINESGSSGAHSFTYFDGDVYFNANAGTGDELWKYNLTSNNTTPVTSESSSSFRVEHLYAHDDLLFFEGYTRELWKSDGTINGTQLVKDLNQNINEIKGSTNELFIAALELWVSNGTSFGTVELNPINPNGYSSSPEDLFSIGSTMFFTATDGELGRELWKNDEVAVSELAADINSKSRNNFSNSIEYNGTIYLSGVSSDSILWKSDGTPHGTETSVYASGHGSLRPIAIWNGGLFFIANDSNNYNSSFSLWVTNGSQDRTSKRAEINSSSDEEFGGVVAHPSNLYFYTYNANSDTYTLYITDGTESGTMIVHEDNRSQFIFFNDDLYHVQENGRYNWELFKNGALLKEINNSGASDPLDFKVFNGQLYFTANGGATGRELWKTDGTSTGTVLVKDINPNINYSSLPKDLIIVKDELFFTARNSSNIRTLWKSDGTNAGTIELTPNELASSTLTFFNGHLYFSASSGDDDFELYRTSRTGAGTTMVKNINADTASLPQNLFVHNNKLYFSADDCDHGRELWQTDGTESGTSLVIDLNPNGASSYPQRFKTFNDKLLFLADDGEHGLELFALDPCPSSINENCTSGPCDLTTSYQSSGDILLSGHYTVNPPNTITLDAGGTIELQEGFEVNQGGILNILNVGCE